MNNLEKSATPLGFKLESVQKVLPETKFSAKFCFFNTNHFNKTLNFTQIFSQTALSDFAKRIQSKNVQKTPKDKALLELFCFLETLRVVYLNFRGRARTPVKFQNSVKSAFFEIWKNWLKKKRWKVLEETQKCEKLIWKI